MPSSVRAVTAVCRSSHGGVLPKDAARPQGVSSRVCAPQYGFTPPEQVI
jgi:hypothetical protein